MSLEIINDVVKYYSESNVEKLRDVLKTGYTKNMCFKKCTYVVTKVPNNEVNMFLKHNYRKIYYRLNHAIIDVLVKNDSEVFKDYFTILKFNEQFEIISKYTDLAIEAKSVKIIKYLKEIQENLSNFQYII